MSLICYSPGTSIQPPKHRILPFRVSSIVAQLYPTYEPSLDDVGLSPDAIDPEIFERSFLHGQSQTAGRWAMFNWADLWAIAPWLQERIKKQVDGLGLGIE